LWPPSHLSRILQPLPSTSCPLSCRMQTPSALPTTLNVMSTGPPWLTTRTSVLQIWLTVCHTRWGWGRCVCVCVQACV
jgi:hypothetical protein